MTLGWDTPETGPASLPRLWSGAANCLTGRPAWQKIPGMLGLLDPARGAGMHATATIDFGVVVSGRVILGLEDGQVELGPGDCVVQRGTWHAWHNPWEEPCVLAFTMLRTGPAA